MSKIIIIGAGGVGNVVAHKCAQIKTSGSKSISQIILASRTIKKCEKIAKNVKDKTGVIIEIKQIDADDINSTSEFLLKEKANMLINVALPYQDLSLMEACLISKTNYLDTANYEPKEEAKFEYKWQWAYQDRFKERGLVAILGSGFDPGVTNIFCAYAQKHLFDEIETIDIYDANDGDHGHPFATNFNPEINIREITQKGKYWENGEWVEVDPMSVSKKYDYPEIGLRNSYLLYHEELESLSRNIKGLKKIRFWMTFSEKYLQYLKVLIDVGMTSITPLEFQGKTIQPIQFLKKVLPEPSSLGKSTIGKTCIGCDIVGIKNNVKKRYFIYNVCDHQKAYSEVGSQAISYTTGVPATIGAELVLNGTWSKPGVWNLEQLDPDIYMKLLNKYGLPWKILELDNK